MRSILGQQEIVAGGGATEISLAEYIKSQASRNQSGNSFLFLAVRLMGGIRETEIGSRGFCRCFG